MTALPEATVVNDWQGPPHIQLHRKPVTHGGRSWEQHIYLSGEGGIGVVAFTVFQDRLLLVSQFRSAIGETLIELPRGFGHSPEDGRTLEQQAILDAERETLEETGIATKSSTFLGYIWADSGILGNKIAVVVSEAESDEPIIETDAEVDEVLWLSKSAFLESVRSGKITDGITLGAYTLWSAMTKNSSRFGGENETTSSYPSH